MRVPLPQTVQKVEALEQRAESASAQKLAAQEQAKAMVG